MIRLGVNIDHVATVRQARLGVEPDPVHAAVLAELGGADQITVHLREDRRHINDRDLRVLRETIKTRLNLEMACTPEMVEIALETEPDMVTLVPEKRQELTTEGGLDVIKNFETINDAVSTLKSAGIFVSLFVDPDNKQIDASAETHASAVELHTGAYADAKGAAQREELSRIMFAGEKSRELGLVLNSGHGLNYRNVGEIVCIPGMYEVNIGHSIISRAIYVGLEKAVREMKDIIHRALMDARV
ncbi:pyridoxal phosphate biosynthetic protein PdxJ [Denitrovibrio acetiphilus DSM 12809]|uniref:Pyridoxine 5'-phosphate synthase n=1 Tax=Denitrovibrio acetiphilus (strain DSM 12809 / NBRC 114555 / N2460) TaxID=522772 RepID=D4H7S4_DENA2|nr:pyridoxine 5'-phosphate synthase [Denitrovibrio acetiphilus]ADD68073.1 pyridoxal phosphate biosynthetic protein PdxJ [Denitrovibrio acetiphilus DSM 12809]